MKTRLFAFERMKVAVLVLILLAAWCDASNWAQVSGKISQNIVVPYYPAPNRPHWAARFGMVTITVKQANESSSDVLYLLGGDTYDGDTSARSQLPGVLDMKWEVGYKNDVWKMTGTEWALHGDPRLRGAYHQKIPKVESKVKWDSVQQGLRPPRGTTFEEWTKCEPFFRNVLNNERECTDPNKPPPPNTMWSPRRHHAGVYFNGHLWIMGGRAREFIDLPEERSIGGIIGPHVKDITEELTEQRFSTQREASVVKSDVWRSLDGKKWTLINPGCRSQQSLLIAKGHPSGGKQGTIQYKCERTSDCYGAELCVEKTCVCNMWSPREQHALTEHGGFMYVSGGYASRLYNQFSNCGPYACGDTDASAYRYFMADLWQSADGNIWTLLTEGTATSWRGRGGHQMLAIVEANNIPYLWVIGGRGGDQTEMGGPEVYFNDIWRAPITGSNVGTFTRFLLPDDVHGSPPTERPPGYHHMADGGMPWLPRTGHTVALETGSDAILGIRTLYLYGGYNNGTFFEDLWSLRIDDPSEGWRQDFTPQAYYSTGVGTEFKYHLNSPSSSYVTPDSPLHMLQRYWVPTHPYNSSGTPVERRIYLSQDKVKMMNSVGLHTIRDLAEIDLYTLLKLRGFDYPQVPKSERLKMYDVCDYRALAMALVEKCSLNLPSLFDGQRNMPWNIKPVFGGAPPADNKIKWHGRDNYDFLLPEVDDPVVLTDKWDGCTYNPLIQGLFGPNVDGLGYVDQVLTVRNPKAELQELFCRQTPGKRAYHNMVVFEQRLYVLGGKQSEKFFYADAWYRDSKLPKARIRMSPGSRDTFPWFHFVSDKPGSYFEYRVWDPNTFKELREWTPVVKKTDIGWLDWRMGGPGNGRYQLYVRAIDPAGNRDATYLMNYNAYNWYYLSPTPWDIILGTIFGFLFLCFLAYMEYRRRVKKAAMERYAMKRMRRKFKAMQRDINGRAVDWRTLYMESKANEEAGIKDKKKKKKSRDKNAEKREKDRKKREKEKELIKKKLAASKDHKEKLRKEKDEEATMDAAPKKLTGGKKSRVAPGSGGGDDDSDVGLDELLINDENEKAGRPGAVKVKGKPAAKGSKGVAVAGDANDGLEGMEGDAPVAPLKLKDKEKTPSKPSAAGGTVAIADSSKEVGAGQLKASADTETGTKQRRVNKQLKEYDGGGTGPDAKKNS